MLVDPRCSKCSLRAFASTGPIRVQQASQRLTPPALYGVVLSALPTEPPRLGKRALI
jgi:hypothetical protein